MRQLDFARPSAIVLEDETLTDHNRSSIAISYQRIHDTVRTQFGQLRKYHIADKRSFSLSWEMLPETSLHTVDGGMGAREMQNFFLEKTGQMFMTITYNAGDSEEVSVIITEFSIDLQKRWNPTNFYNVSLSLEEV
jgi:hypothetical protein